MRHWFRSSAARESQADHHKKVEKKNTQSVLARMGVAYTIKELDGEFRGKMPGCRHLSLDYSSFSIDYSDEFEPVYGPDKDSIFAGFDAQLISIALDRRLFLRPDEDIFNAFVLEPSLTEIKRLGYIYKNELHPTHPRTLEAIP